MADRKISELPELTTASGDDLVPVVDVSANETKKIGVDEFFQSSTLLATTGTTASNALSLAQGNQTSITSQQTSINSLDTRLINGVLTTTIVRLILLFIKLIYTVIIYAS